MNRFAWDFRIEQVPDVPNAFVYGNYQGHRVKPGKYTAKITYNGKATVSSMLIIPDPRLDVADKDWEDQQQFLRNVRASITVIHQAIIDIRKVKKQVQAYNELLKDQADKKELVDAGKTLIKKMDDWESDLIETRQKNGQDVINWPSKLNAEYFQLLDVADTHDPRITQGATDRFADLERKWSASKSIMNDLLNNDIAEYNRKFREGGIPAIIVGGK
jgi:hypothetical protein